MAHVLFVCLHNAGRSQMSRALFERAADGRHTADSAGTTPGDRVHPEVVAVMGELGVDLSDRVPQRLTTELAQRADVVVTMGCGDECPYIPGKRYIDWELPGPEGPARRGGARDARRDRAAGRDARRRARRHAGALSALQPLREQRGLQRALVARVAEPHLVACRATGGRARCAAGG